MSNCANRIIELTIYSSVYVELSQIVIVVVTGSPVIVVVVGVHPKTLSHQEVRLAVLLFVVLIAPVQDLTEEAEQNALVAAATVSASPAAASKKAVIFMAKYMNQTN